MEVSKGTVIVRPNLNLVPNGSFETGDPATGWTVGQGTISRSTTQVKLGTYSEKLISGASGIAWFYVNNVDNAEYYANRLMTFGCWVWCATAASAYIQLDDTAGSTASSYHTGGSTWEWITVSRVMGGGSCQPSLRVVLGTITAYFDGAICNALDTVTLGSFAAGTNAIGKLASNSGVDIGDVDVLSIAAGTNAIGKVGHDTTGLGHGVKTVSTVGTDEVLAASTACKWVVIQAQTDNTSKVAVGASGVDATVATGNGIILDPGDWTPRIDTDNLADIFVDALVAGEGCRYIYGI